MKQVFLSVIIPTLNEERLLPRVLDDLKKQTFKNFEIVIIDGNSDDNTIKVIQRFSKILPIKFFSVRKRNVSFQRNYGVIKSRGNYLLFLDADSQVPSSFLANLEMAIEKTGGRLFLPYLVPDTGSTHHKIVFKLANLIIKTSQKIGKPFSSGGSFLIEKELFKLAGGFDENIFLGEDHDLVQKANFWGAKAKMLNNTRITVSLRRTKKEGNIKLLYKYLIAASYILINGKITYKIFEYDMGGGINKKSSQLKKNFPIVSKISSVFIRPSFLLVFVMGFLVFLISGSSSSQAEGVNARSFISYKKYQKVLVSRVIAPMKAISLREFRIVKRNGDKIKNQEPATSFLAS